MAAKTDWVTGEEVNATKLNALGTEINGKATAAQGAKADSALQVVPADSVGWSQLNAAGTPSATTFLKVTADGSLSAADPPAGGGATNLAATLSASQTIITSDTGTDATIPAVDGTNAGVMTPAMKTKLDGIGSTGVYTQNVGNGSATTIAVTHNFGTKNVGFELYEAATGETVDIAPVRTDNNTLTLTFGTAPTLNQYVAVVWGGAQSTTVASTDITDSGAVGRAVLAAATQGAARTAIGAIQAADILTAAKNVYTGQQELNGGFTNAFDTTLWVCPPFKTNPTINTQGLYVQHRVSGDLGGFVHDAAASELRFTGSSNTGAGQNAHECSLVVTGGVNALGHLAAVVANFHTAGTPTGTTDRVSLVRAQTIPALAAGFTVDKAVGVYVEPQTVGTTDNHCVYAPDGSSVFGPIVAKDSTAAAVIAKGRSDTVAGTTLLSVQNSAATTLFRVTSSGTAGLGSQVTGCVLWTNVDTASAGTVALRVQAHPSQTASLVEFRESGGTTHMKVTAATSSKRASLVVAHAALSTTATDGFLYLSSIAGAPTGTPTAFTGTVPIVIDTTNNKLMAYIGGAWKGVTLS